MTNLQVTHQMTIYNTHVKEDTKKEAFQLVKSRLFSEVYGENDELIYKRIDAEEIMKDEENNYNYLATFILKEGKFYRLLDKFYFVQDGNLIEKSYEQVYDAFISVEYQPKGKLIKLPLTYHPKTFFEKSSASVFWEEEEVDLYKKSLSRRKDNREQVEEIREDLNVASKNVHYIARYYTKDLHLGKDAPLLRKYVSRVPFDEVNPSETYAWLSEGQYYELIEGDKPSKDKLVKSAAVRLNEDGELTSVDNVIKKVVQANKDKQSHELIELYYWKDKTFNHVLDIISLRRDVQDLYQIYYEEVYMREFEDEDFSILTMFREIREGINDTLHSIQPELGKTPKELFHSYKNILHLKSSLNEVLHHLGVAIAHGKVNEDLHVSEDKEWLVVS